VRGGQVGSGPGAKVKLTIDPPRVF